MLDGLRSHVCVDSYTYGHMSLVYQLSSPCKVTWRGGVVSQYSERRDVKNSLLSTYEGYQYNDRWVCPPPALGCQVYTFTSAVAPYHL